MTTKPSPGAPKGVSPEEAFGILGDNARFEILQALGDADEPLTYSEIFERITYDDLSNYSYHLDQLVGHFAEKIDDRYAIRRPGERVLEAVHSGAVTTNPVRERAQTDRPCPVCSAPIEVGYEQERVTMHCPECSGLLGQADSDRGRATKAGNLGYRPLPPAAVDGRTTAEIHDVSKTWTALTVHAIGRGVCPRCSGNVDHAVDVCESHTAGGETCDRCGRRFGAMASIRCTNCVFDLHVGIAPYLLTRIEPMRFLIEHGIDPIAPGSFHPYAAVEENILSHHPFEARYTFTVDDDTLTCTVDGDLSIVELVRSGEREASDRYDC